MKRFLRRPVLWSGFLAMLGVIGGLTIPPTAATAARRHAVTSHSASAPCSSVAYALSLSLGTATGTTTVPVTGQIDFADADATATVVLPADLPIAALAGITENVVLIGGTLYLSVPASLQAFVDGASWAQVKLPSGIGSAVDSFGSMLAGWCANSQSLVDLLEARGVSVTSLGSTTVGGVAVTGQQVESSGRHLRPVTKVVRRLDPQVAQLKGTTPVTIDIWSNSEGQLVELSVDVNSTEGALQSATLTVTFSDFDQPVTITAPSGAFQISARLLRLLGREGLPIG